MGLLQKLQNSTSTDYNFLIIDGVPISFSVGETSVCGVDAELVNTSSYIIFCRRDLPQETQWIPSYYRDNMDDTRMTGHISTKKSKSFPVIFLLIKIMCTFAVSKNDSVAQLVEQLTLNQWVEGSSPSGVTETRSKIKKNPDNQ